MKTEVRIDKWLWAVRLFKTRTLAADACKKGKVIIQNVQVKPSRNVKVGDVVLYGKYAGTEINIDGKDYLIMRESDILAIL